MKKGIQSKPFAKKETLPIPTLIKSHIGKPIRIYLEIARSPDGLTTQDLATRFVVSKSRLWYHLQFLRDANLIDTTYETKNSHVEMICRVIPEGLDKMRKETRCVADMLDAIIMEKVKEVKK